MATSKSRKSSSQGASRKTGAAKSSGKTRKSTSGKTGSTGQRTKASRKRATPETERGPGEKQAEKTEKTDAATSPKKRPSMAGKKKRGEYKDISRKELVQKALERLKEQLEKEADVTPATIGALEKLLKLDRDIVEETEMPQEIRVLWQEINDESSKDQ